jgi:hypothetical protein
MASALHAQPAMASEILLPQEKLLAYQLAIRLLGEVQEMKVFFRWEIARSASPGCKELLLERR